MNATHPTLFAAASRLAVHPARRRFGRRIRRFVAFALSGAGRLPNLPSMEAGRTLMNTKSSLVATAVALAVNAAALIGLNQAMTEGGVRAELAQTEPARMVVTAKRMPGDTVVTKASSAGRRS
jgi:hypothetical protein